MLRFRPVFSLTGSRFDRAAAAFCGFLPLALLNALLLSQAAAKVSGFARLWHHGYDAGQIVALGAVGFVFTYALASLPARARMPSACVVAFGLSYALLYEDLSGFVERHSEAWLPIRAAFALTGATCLLGSVFVGDRLTRIGARAVGTGLGLAAGLGLVMLNRHVLELAYPGMHLLLATCAAAVMGAPLSRALCAKLTARWLARALALLALLALPSLLLSPSAELRTALLRSPGAVAAPFVARAWHSLQRAKASASSHRDGDPWWQPRTNHPPIPPTAFAGRIQAPIVVLLTIDAVRGDLIETPAWSAQLPHLTALRTSSLRFSRAWSAAASTRPALTSLFLGTYFSQQSWNRHAKQTARGRGPVRMPDQAQGPYLATLLERSAVSTVHLLSHGSLAPGLGIAEGFGEVKNLGSHASSEQIVHALLERLRRDAKGPLFIYAHDLDPHFPYNRGRARGSQQQRYLAEIVMVDRALGELMRGLRTLGLADRLYLVIAADHGEAFYEHGFRFHARTVYEEMVRVPLYVHGPNVAPRRIKQAVSLLDLPATVLDLFGAQTPGHFMGQSLVPFIAGGSPKLVRPLAVDSERGARGMLFGGRYKAMEHIHEGTEEVYDLKADPKEQHNLADSEAGQRHLAALREFFEVHAGQR